MIAVKELFLLILLLFLSITIFQYLNNYSFMAIQAWCKTPKQVNKKKSVRYSFCKHEYLWQNGSCGFTKVIAAQMNMCKSTVL